MVRPAARRCNAGGRIRTEVRREYVDVSAQKKEAEYA